MLFCKLQLYYYKLYVEETGKHTMNILVIEDDKKTAEYIILGLTQAGFAVAHASDGAEGLLKAKMMEFDLAVVDIMLPKMDGITVVERMRAIGIIKPIIFLSAKSSIDDKINGLTAGGDDYITKPFSFSELLARINAQIRRSNFVAEPNSLTYKNLRIDLLKRKAFRDEKPIELQPLEFQLLEYLVRNSGRVVTKITILEHVWEYNFDTGTNIVEAAIFRLREKIDKTFEPKLIHTVRGFGYVLE